MAPGLFELSGSQSPKPVKAAPLFIEDLWSGLYTNRAVLHDPSGLYERRYLGGRPGTMLDGLNVEVSVRNTAIRRYGVSQWTSSVYPTSPNRALWFEDLGGTLRVLIDTGAASFTLTSCGASSGFSQVYSGTIPNGGTSPSFPNGAFAGYYFTVTGFAASNGINNGTFLCISSTTTQLVLQNDGISETHAATAATTGAVYYDEQNGTSILLKAKGLGAGQTNGVAVAGIMYLGDGAETWMYTPLNTNNTIWGWGIPAPTTPPAVTTTSSGAAAVNWQGTTMYGTMGLITDTTDNWIFQLESVNANPTQFPNTTVNPNNYGVSGSGQPTIPAIGLTVSDNGITWRNSGPIVLWTPNTTYSDATIGGTLANPCIIYDPGTNACYIANISAGKGTSNNSYALRPVFKPGAGQITQDTSSHPGAGIFWYWIGLPGVWQPNHHYDAIGVNYDFTNNYATQSLSSGLPGNITAAQTAAGTATNITYWMLSMNGGTSSSTGYSPFNSTNASTGAVVPDGNLQWLGLSSKNWSSSLSASPWTADGTPFTAIVDSNGNYQVCTAITGAGTPNSIQPGGVTYTLTQVQAATPSAGQATFHYSGSPSIPSSVAGYNLVTTGFVASSGANNGTWSIVSIGGGLIVVKDSQSTTVNETHAGSGVFNPWATVYKNITQDGTVIWTCMGASVTWVRNTQWERPTGGFQPPFGTQGYGGSAVIDTNNNIEFAINNGLSATVSNEPVWSTKINQGNTNSVTNDGTGSLQWYNLEASTPISLSWSKGYSYAYSYKSRSLTDYYSVNVSGTSSPPIPPGNQAVNSLNNPPIGAQDGGISTCSPAFTMSIAAVSNAINYVSGVYSGNPAVDTIVIYRSADGGGSGAMFELTEINNISSKAGQTWTFADTLPDVPQSVGGITYPGLNELEPAPINHVNDPPPSSSIPQDYNFQRVWVEANGLQIFFSGGPDTQVGNPQANFNPADEFQFLSLVRRAVKNTQGLVVYTAGSVEIIMGGPTTASFFTVTLGPGIGLSNFNGLDIYAGEQHFIDTNGLLRILSPTLSVTSAGFPILDQLLTLNPNAVYLAFYDGPNDTAMYIGTGSTPYAAKSSTGWFRCNPRQTPGGANGPEPVWSPFAAITTTCNMLQSVQISPGLNKLLVGATSGGQTIMKRDTSVFQDNGASYPSNFKIGNLWLAHRGEIAILKFLEADFALVTTAPTVSYLLNEISGAYTNFVNGVNGVPQPDPPELYGTTIFPQSYNPYRFYFSSNASLARCVHMQVGVDFGTRNQADEIFDLTLYGAISKAR